MHQSDDWREHLFLLRDARTASARAEFSRRCARGELVRVESGAYLRAETWHGLDDRKRFLTRARIAAAKADDDMTFTHGAAAIIWGLPWFGALPDKIDILLGPARSGHYSSAVRRRTPRGCSDTEVIDGLRVTSLVRTVADIAADPSFPRAICVGDAALNPRTREGLAGRTEVLRRADLYAELERGSSAPTRARDAVGFMDGRSESVGESVSRVSIARAGLPSPVLQQRFGSWAVDFWWPEFEVVGEFDGAIKYLDAAMRDGRSAEEIVYAEKLREDELRRHVRGFARWKFSEAMSPTLLGRRLRDAGVRPSRRTRFATI